MRTLKSLLVATLVVMIAASLITAPAAAWDLGITYQETCDGYGVTVNPGVYYSGIYKYVPFETQVNNGGGWNSVPYSDYSGSLNPWNPSGQHNYEIKIHYRVYRWFLGFWILQPGTHTEGPVHHRVNKPDDCFEPWYDLTQNDCEGWVVTRYDSPEDEGTVVDQGYWTEPFVLEKADSYGFHIDEPEECQIPHDGVVDLENDCDSWRVFYILDGEEITVAGGTWTDIHKLEAAEFGAFTIPVDEGEEIEITDPLNLMAGGIVSEPAECFVCEVTPQYRLITLIDYDAEDWYWGQGARNGTCWVEMRLDDTSPGVAIWRQAEICSVCEHPDFVFEADDVLYDDVVGIDCHGNIFYPDPLWNTEWFDSDFPDDCRQASCLNPEVKPAIPES